jgi:hypothetical protein
MLVVVLLDHLCRPARFIGTLLLITAWDVSIKYHRYIEGGAATVVNRPSIRQSVETAP